MASPPPPRPSPPLNGSTADPLFLETLLSRLQLRPPFLDTNSFLSQSLDDFLLHHNLDDDDDDEDDANGDGGHALGASGGGNEENRRRMLAKEEAKLEKEIISIVRSGTADEALKPNSGQSVSIGDHNICVASHEEPGSEYRVWEWHGHIMLFDYEDGYSAEYIYGNYFERLPDSKNRGGCDKQNQPKKREEEEEEEEEDIVRDLGLRDLISENSKKGAGAGGARVLHRNALNSGLAASLCAITQCIQKRGLKIPVNRVRLQSEGYLVT